MKFQIIHTSGLKFLKMKKKILSRYLYSLCEKPVPIYICDNTIQLALSSSIYLTLLSSVFLLIFVFTFSDFFLQKSFETGIYKALSITAPWNLNPVNLCHEKDYLKEQGSGHFC